MPPRRARPAILSPAYWHPPAAGRAGNKLLYGPVSWRPGVIPVRAFTRPLQGIPLTGGQGQAIVSTGSSGSSGTPALAQPAVQTSNTVGTTLTVTLGNPTTAGNCLIVTISAKDSTANPTVQGIMLGGSADHFVVAKTAYNNADVNVATWIDPNCAGGQTSIVITFTGDSGGSPGVAANAMEWSGLTASPLDAVNGQNGTTTAWSSLSSGTLAQASELVVGTVGFGASTTPALTGPGSPWTNFNQNNYNAAGGVVAQMTGYQVVSSTAAQTYSGTESGGAGPQYGACIVTLKAAPASPAVIGGLALVSVGPQGLGNVWYPAQVTVSTTSGVNDTSTCQVFLGPAGVPVTLLGTIFPGGIGTLGAAVPPLAPGQYLIAQWTGGNPGDVAAINVIGTMDSVMPG